VIAYQHNDGAVRYVMHETVRQYAAERLLTRGDAPVVVNRFIAYYVGLTERAFAHLRQADEGNWFQQLGTELSNLRTALQLCKDYDDSQRGLRLATALTRFWRLTGFASEGRYWLSQFLSTDASPADQSQRAWALHGLGRLALAQGDVTNALTTTEESLAIARRLPDQLPLMVEGLHQLGWIRHWQGDTMSARSALEEGLALARDIGNERQVADHLSDLADLLRLQGERARAREFYRESLELTRTLDDPTGVATNQACLGSICLAEGEHLEAARLLRGALQLYTSFHNRLSAVVCIAGLGGVAASRGQSDKAARLLASVDALLTSMGAQLDPADRADFERSLALCRTQVDDAAFVIAWAEGQALRLEQAIDLALTA
jgi:non-specific serine/threonine protein kinase